MDASTHYAATPRVRCTRPSEDAAGPGDELAVELVPFVAEVERLLQHGREAAPMDRARPVAHERGEVLGRRVTLVLREAVHGIIAIELDQQRVARGLREDARRRDDGHPPVALHD